LKFYVKADEDIPVTTRIRNAYAFVKEGGLPSS